MNRNNYGYNLYRFRHQQNIIEYEILYKHSDVYNRAKKCFKFHIEIYDPSYILVQL